MVGTVVAGLDGSPESRAAAEWAAREARLRGLPLKVVHVREPVPDPFAQAPQRWSERVAREAGEGLRLRHPGVEVTVEQTGGRPADVLVDAAKDAELLVLGSRGLGGLGGFLVGSVGLSVAAHAEVPVVLVRALTQAADEHAPDPTGIPSAAAPFRPVVLGLATDDPAPALVAFAFEEADRRGTALRIVHGWNPPPYYTYNIAADLELHGDFTRERTATLTEALRPWRQKYPTVEVVAEARYGTPGNHLVDAAREASLVVVGRRVRRGTLGARLGPVTHAVLHHSPCPVAVVPHRA
ncbi:UspA domain-containing protein [Actinobacteria bacterium OK074]|nr:UspA domain-containing protein [Actinobacteria bacterium OK074]